ncbi:MAG: D-amino acid aminotransferase [Alcanivoracaceae bacterium]|nr:D-amino acid aminotransferase [Alcanivoracaceae bacterium]
MGIAYLNGELLPLEEARISPLDRGFLFADGIYEVIPAYSGVLFRLDEHLERLEHSLREIQLDNPHTRPQWKKILQSVIEKNGGGNISVYLQITRGAPAKRDHAYPEHCAPTVFAMTNPIATPAADTPDTCEGVAVITMDDIRWARCDIKSIALLPNVMMRQHAVQQGSAEAILIRDGFATEGSATNFFIVSNGVVVTPPKSHLILPGITRDLTVELCQENGIAIEEREVTEIELKKADEIWLSSSTKEIVPVVTLNGNSVGNGEPGEIWKSVAHLYVHYKRKLCGEA